MAEFTEYKPGTPAWIDLGTSDLSAAVAFYTRLFGWVAHDVGAEAGHYTMMTWRGKYVAAVSPLMSPDQPVAWSTYLCTADADATAAKVRAAGGTVLAEPMDVFTSGRLAAFMDPTGAAVLTWQPRDHIGAQLANEPNTWIWNELMTRDPEAAKSFYEAAFGLGNQPVEGMDYTILTVDGKAVAGMVAMGDDVPAQVPPHWVVYFGVEDCDAAVKKVTELGGSTMVPPRDIPGAGRFAIVADGQGASFAVMKGAS